MTRSWLDYSGLSSPAPVSRQVRSMDFRVLGPLQATRRGAAVPLSGSLQRRLLAVLLLRANRLVTPATIVEALWQAQPPKDPANLVHVHVSRLRRLLEPELSGTADGYLRTEPGGYLLQVDRAELDLLRFQDLAASARMALAAGRYAQVAEQLRQALDLWCGPVLDGDVPFGLEADAALLEEQRMSAFEEFVDAELTLGRHAQVVADLHAQTAAHPLRERLYGQLMLALYRCGRQAEALAAYRKARQTLGEEHGIDPSVDLQRLERAILTQDPAIAVPGPPIVVPAPADPSPPRPATHAVARRWGRQSTVLAVVALGAAAIAAGIVAPWSKQVGGAVRPSPTGARPPVIVPHHSTSYVVLTSDAERMRDLGCAAGRRDAIINGAQNSIVVLSFGSPSRLGGRTGTLGVAREAGASLSIAQVKQLARGYAGGYAQCLKSGGDTASHIRIAVSVTGRGPLLADLADARAHGTAWASLVRQLNAEQNATPSWTTVDFAAGMDAGPAPTSAAPGQIDVWQDGYASVGPAKTFDRGGRVDAEVAGYLYYHGDTTPCIRAGADGSCGHGWTVDDIEQVAWRAAPAIPLPQVGSVHHARWWASFWHRLSTRGAGDVLFSGVMLPETASPEWTPGRAWTVLRDELMAAAAPTQVRPRWSTATTRVH